MRFIFPLSLRVTPTLLLQISLPEGNNAVPPRLLNADPLAQIIGTESIANVIKDDVEACALLDSKATVDLMSSSYAKARNFDARPITELNDHFVNLKLTAGFQTSMLNTTSGYKGSHPVTWIELPWSVMTTPSLGRRYPS